MDIDSDEVVDMEEYMLYAREALHRIGKPKQFRKLVYESSMQIYDASDIDDDGVLSEREVDFGECLGIELLGPINSEAVSSEDVGAWLQANADEAAGLLHLADEDEDGELDRQEFNVASFSVFYSRGVDLHDFEGYAGYDFAELSADMSRCFAVADITGDGRLNQRELQYASFLMLRYVSQASVCTLFHDFDHNMDEVLTREEVEARLTPEGKQTASLAAEVLESFFSLDADGDGRLDPWEAWALAERKIRSNKGPL